MPGTQYSRWNCPSESVFALSNKKMSSNKVYRKHNTYKTLDKSPLNSETGQLFPLYFYCCLTQWDERGKRLGQGLLWQGITYKRSL